MLCPNCGKEISDKSIYCNKCGVKINNDEITSIMNEDIEDPTIISNSEKIKIKKVIIGLIVLVVICCAGFGGYKYVQAKEFNNLVKTANQKLNAGNCDEAIQLYNKALTYRSDSNVQKELAEAQKYKQYQSIYNQGLKLMNNKKYSEAIQKFSSIDQSAVQIYNNAQSKISQCKKNAINDDIQNTDNAIENGDYDTANKYIDDILKIDANSSDAKRLKAKIVQAQGKSKAKENVKEQQQAINSSIIIKYSIDERGYVMDTNYPNGSSIQLKVGQEINLIGNVSSKSSQRVLFDGSIMKSLSSTVIKTTTVGGGDINIIPNSYDWDKAYKYHIVVSN
ncbi:zinc-ribbon domain-containing protein [Clostridium fermenticellae]|uniref:Zinc-ribbon domain-containing protein n=1 Tax=Clostridium fermenticellae TaxID=2068654 RepID=A0A386H2A8_9CLOT|nr:zinc ribbon domain-containing protein [Clostridium fermenticellae]AYD39837.1 zinc-ribbon domain-containing protein [Clostridium fermenticellae]